MLQIPLSEGDDRRIWHYSKNEQYSIKNGYNLALAKLTNNPSPSSSHRNRSWKSSSKVRVFGWHACKDILSVLTNLQGVTATEIPLCPRCHGVPKTELHAPRDCVFTNQVWMLSHIHWALISISVNSVKTWSCGLLSSL
ncbi:hypothetical protein Salat_1865600 [Sesamum alatum]|uniref:Reverse transcriptase zinc-binding domain-containing protein n=1 Tax=Sesamum alatum TaxID=300844 RepID=A0AAE1Y307_9LAMI|nr:hypothetical protein Salat_1865600 [Sesamum alatum]